MRLSLLLSIVTYIFLSTSCSTPAFQIKGSIPDAADLSVYFDKVNSITRTNSVVAKSQTNSSGSFKLALEAPPAKGTYRVRVGAKSVFLVIDGTEKDININGSLLDISKYEHKVTGSPLTEAFIQKNLESLNGTIPVSQLSEYAASQGDALVGMLIGTQRFQDLSFAPLHAKIANRLVKEYPDEPFSADYVNFAKQMNLSYQKQQAMNKVKIGELAPDIILPNVNGEEMKLSDLRGQVVLLDFWASWCGPCRRENPNVVRVYDKYNRDGFTVFSVSLDGLDSRTKARFPEDQIANQMRSQKQRWVNAIKKDNLKWDTHVSDLQKWESPAAAEYGVTSIPRTFLLDRDGRIAAINPRRNLEQAVTKILSGTPG